MARQADTDLRRACRDRGRSCRQRLPTRAVRPQLYDCAGIDIRDQRGLR